MVTKEEIMKVIAYCRDNNASYQDAVKLFGIPRSQFYKYKNLYLSEEQSQKESGEAPQGEFLQLAPGAAYEVATMEGLEKSAARKHKAPKPASSPEPKATKMQIELIGAKGTTMRICGELTVGMVRELAKMI